MIKIHEDTTYGEFKRIIAGHQCKLIFKDRTSMYIDQNEIPSHDVFASVDTVEIIDQKRICIADKAKEIIYGDREKTHGNPDKNVKTIAEFWSTYLDVEISKEQVCDMMCLLKLARSKNDPVHEEHNLDNVGYALLKERLINKC